MKAGVFLAMIPIALHAQDAREIVRKSVQLDQSNGRRARDYTWTGQRFERHVNDAGQVTSEKRDRWETIILYGEVCRKFTERNSKPLSAGELRKQQERIDRQVAMLRNETPDQKQRRLASEEKAREKDREFLSEIPDLYHLRIEREDQIEGRPVWVISATPNPSYKPKTSDGKDLLKIKGTLWIDQAEYQWVRIEAETVGTLTWGFFLGRVNPGAKLIFEETRINDELWLPKRQMVSGTARIIGKKISGDEEITWSNYKKFSVESNIVGQ
jgi:hypothetical protein